MTKIKLLALGVLIATSASAAHADGKFTLGAGVGIVEHPYKQYDADVYPVPVISYESDNFWFHGLGGGYYLWNDTNDKLSITAYWSPMYFKPGDSDSEQMRRLDKRKSTVMAGLSYVHNTPYGFLRTTIAGDTLDNSNGINWDLAWLYRYTNGNLTLTPGIGGVEQRQSERILLWCLAARVPSQRHAQLRSGQQLEPVSGAVGQLSLPRRLERIRYCALHPSVG